jgi:hypothetical protein
MAPNLRNRILAANDIKVEKVSIPEWGGDYYIRVISGADRDAFEASYADQKMKSFRVRFLVLSLCDETGDRIFTDADADVAELSKKSAVVINRVFEAAWKANAFSQEAVDALGEDSPAGQSAGSSSN